MKQIFPNKIVNIDKNLFDNKFLFSYLEADFSASEIEVFFMEEILAKKENTDLLNNLNGKFAMYSEVYSPKDELKIFEELFEYALTNNKKIHIVGITLKEELAILEKYYEEQGYLREDVNCYIPDFKNTLVTVSVKIENLIWKGSDYKAQKKNIFFIPPVRESGQNKAMFKGINRGSIASIFIKDFGEVEKNFLETCIKTEKILPMTIGKVLCFNKEDVGFQGKDKTLVINYSE